MKLGPLDITPAEVFWWITAFIGLAYTLQLHNRAVEDKWVVLNSKTNGARLLVASSILRRYRLSGVAQTLLLFIATFVLFFDTIPDHLRWISPVCLTFVVILLTVNARLDDRDRKRIIDFIERVEVRARQDKQTH